MWRRSVGFDLNGLIFSLGSPKFAALSYLECRGKSKILDESYYIGEHFLFYNMDLYFHSEGLPCLKFDTFQMAISA